MVARAFLYRHTAPPPWSSLPATALKATVRSMSVKRVSWATHRLKGRIGPLGRGLGQDLFPVPVGDDLHSACRGPRPVLAAVQPWRYQNLALSKDIANGAATQAVDAIAIANKEETVNRLMDRSPQFWIIRHHGRSRPRLVPANQQVSYSCLSLRESGRAFAERTATVIFAPIP